jgi:endo-beta-N-acetylglucosaminidase D
MVTTSIQLILLQHRSERFIAKDEMIQYTYTKQLTSLDKTLGYPNIVCTGNEHTTGMVVGYNDRCRPLSQWVRKDLPLSVENGTIYISMLKNYQRYTFRFIVEIYVNIC